MVIKLLKTQPRIEAQCTESMTVSVELGWVYCQGEIPGSHHFSYAARTSRTQAGRFLHSCSSAARTTPLPEADLIRHGAVRGFLPGKQPCRIVSRCTHWAPCSVKSGANAHPVFARSAGLYALRLELLAWPYLRVCYGTDLEVHLTP